MAKSVIKWIKEKAGIRSEYEALKIEPAECEVQLNIISGGKKIYSTTKLMKLPDYQVNFKIDLMYDNLIILSRSIEDLITIQLENNDKDFPPTKI